MIEEKDTEMIGDSEVIDNSELLEEDSEMLETEEEVFDVDTENLDIEADATTENSTPAEVFQIAAGTDMMNYIPKGLLFLVKGYLEYAKEVVIDRSIPNIDGLKPSQRRIMYTMKFLERVGFDDLRKCADIAGSTMKLHPHGDASIYDTMVRMTHSSLHLNIPFIHGKGSFGKVYSSDDKPSASRYTECEMAKVSEELFQGMKGIEMTPSYNNTLDEPVLLPVSFPAILCNPSQGVGVGIASNIPSFNFHEVLKATIELIETGEIKKPLAPDFTTGGCYIQNPTELNRLMHTGNAKLKMRGKWHIDGKVIVIDEIPYYTTVEEIKDKVKDLPGVSDVKDESDKRGLRLTIECDTKKLVDQVLKDVLRVSALQMTVNTNIVIVIDDKPKVIGIKRVLEEWVKFRTAVIDKQLKTEIKDLTIEIARYDILVDLMTTDSKREKFMDTLLHQGRAEAKALLREFYPDADETIFEWILEKSVGSLGGVGNKQRMYLEQMRQEVIDKTETLKDVPAKIISELKALDKKYVFPRLTEITEDDYVFTKEDSKKKVEAVPMVLFLDGKFVKKVKGTPTNQAMPGAIKCMSTDTLSLLDNRGRLLRIHLDQIELNGNNDKGTYLPLYLGDNDDKFEVIHYDIVSDKKVGFMYKDGYAAIIDYNEWFDVKRKTKMTPDGLAPAFIKSLIGPFDMTKGCILLFTKKGKLGIVTNDFLQKSRRARTKLIHVGKGDEIVKVESMHLPDLTSCLENQMKFMGHFRVILKTDNFNKELFEKICAGYKQV